MKTFERNKQSFSSVFRAEQSHLRAQPLTQQRSLIWKGTQERYLFFFKMTSKNSTLFPAMLCVGGQELEGTEYSRGSVKCFEPKYIGELWALYELIVY